MKTRRIPPATIRILLGVIVALAVTASFAQTTTRTTNPLHTPESPILSAHYHYMAQDTTPPVTQTQHKAHTDRAHMHVKNWLKQPNGLAGVAPLDPANVPKF